VNNRVNTSSYRSNFTTSSGRTLIAAAVAVTLLAACAAAPVKPSGADEARNKLTRLQADPNLGNLAPAAMAEAAAAVQAAEEPQTDRDLGIYRVYIADREVEIAKALAETRYAESQRTAILAAREAARLAVRTQQLDASRAATDQARSDTLAANQSAADSQQAAQLLAAQALEMQQQIDSLQARATDRGLILTLGDVLFATGQANLLPGAASHLERLVSFLNKYPSRTVEIDGFTDSVGGEDYNLGLSQRRADSVRGYLQTQGIDASRITTSGKGESNPVADNASASGRQQNRRVEVVISNPKVAAAS